MYYSAKYSSPVGPITIACDEDGRNLVGLWIEGQKYFGASIPEIPTEKRGVPLLLSAQNWLDRYFRGEKPACSELPLSPAGSAFRREVWRILCEIPYGEVTTYKAIAQKMASKLGRETMSSQAVGGAVSHNPISIVIPCHRVVGTNGSLTGYAGGIETKVKLLELEQADMSRLFIPPRGTAL